MENQDGNIDGYSRRMDKIDHKLEEIKQKNLYISKNHKSQSQLQKAQAKLMEYNAQFNDGPKNFKYKLAGSVDTNNPKSNSNSAFKISIEKQIN